MSNVSESQKKSRNKWDSEHMAVLTCKLRKEQAEKFKGYAKSKNTTANALLKEFVLNTIKEYESNP